MEKNEEIRYLREEITRLKYRLAELDNDLEPTSVVCGHDVALENLKKLCYQHNLHGLSQIACFDKKWGWYTTNIGTNRIEYFLEDQQTISTLFGIISKKRVWKALTELFNNRDYSLDENTRERLLVYRLIDNNNKLTEKGVLCYIVCGHLCFNVTLKQDIEKTYKIFEVLFELTQKQFGEKLEITYDKMIALLKKNERYYSLINNGVSESDLKKYYYQQCC